MKESGLSIHFQDDNDRIADRKKENPVEKPVKKEEKKEEKKPIKAEKNKLNNHFYRAIMIYIIAITFELITIFLLLPIVLMGVR